VCKLTAAISFSFSGRNAHDEQALFKSPIIRHPYIYI
jgi:hypothetical protein